MQCHGARIEEEGARRDARSAALPTVVRPEIIELHESHGRTTRPHRRVHPARSEELYLRGRTEKTRRAAHESNKEDATAGMDRWSTLLARVISSGGFRLAASRSQRPASRSQTLRKKGIFLILFLGSRKIDKGSRIGQRLENTLNH